VLLCKKPRAIVQRADFVDDSAAAQRATDDLNSAAGGKFGTAC
jgi:hypothetical protein